MDIFTTQLTKVRQVPIKPDKLRVKSLKKDAGARALDEEKDHLLGETQSPDLHPLAHLHEDEEDLEYTKQDIFQAKQKQQLLKENAAAIEKSAAQKTKSADQEDDDDEDHDEHIDIFV
ncbi:MAG: hypothetical protein ACSHW0_06830 [Thalassotalea sp.]